MNKYVRDGICDLEKFLHDAAAMYLDVLAGHAGDLLAKVLRQSDREKKRKALLRGLGR